MFAVTLAAALLAPADPPKDKEPPEAAKKELKKLEGKWTVTKEVTSGGEREQPAIGRGQEVTVEFQGNKFVINATEKFELEVSALDPAVDPKCMDLKSLVEQGPIPKGAVIEGIYKLDGDTLTLAFYAGEDGKNRPANFDPPTDKGVGMWVLKRVKE